MLPFWNATGNIASAKNADGSAPPKTNRCPLQWCTAGYRRRTHGVNCTQIVLSATVPLMTCPARKT